MTVSVKTLSSRLQPLCVGCHGPNVSRKAGHAQRVLLQRVCHSMGPLLEIPAGAYHSATILLPTSQLVPTDARLGCIQLLADESEAVMNSVGFPMD